jgi:hypothetical protein
VWSGQAPDRIGLKILETTCVGIFDHFNGGCIDMLHISRLFAKQGIGRLVVTAKRPGKKIV